MSGNDSHFLVMFSVEVSSGFLSTKLPAELISTTELKLKNSHQWQALQTFVTISKHFMVKARGIRFQGSVNDCNSIMEQLLYHVSEQMQIYSRCLLQFSMIMNLCFSFTLCQTLWYDGETLNVGSLSSYDMVKIIQYYLSNSDKT